MYHIFHNKLNLHCCNDVRLSAWEGCCGNLAVPSRFSTLCNLHNSHYLPHQSRVTLICIGLELSVRGLWLRCSFNTRFRR